MTDAPERLWAGSRETYWQTSGDWDTSGPDPDGVSAEYVRADVTAKEIDCLREAATWLLRHVSGKVLREKGFPLQDTSNLDEFLSRYTKEKL